MRKLLPDSREFPSREAELGTGSGIEKSSPLPRLGQINPALEIVCAGEGGRQVRITAQSALLRVGIEDLSEEVFEKEEHLDTREGEAESD